MNIFKVFVIAMLFTTSLLVANPSGGNVVNGSATINSAGNVLTVNQTTDRAVINWNDFSIAFGETTNFNLPNEWNTDFKDRCDQCEFTYRFNFRCKQFRVYVRKEFKLCRR